MGDQNEEQPIFKAIKWDFSPSWNLNSSINGGREIQICFKRVIKEVMDRKPTNELCINVAPPNLLPLSLLHPSWLVLPCDAASLSLSTLPHACGLIFLNLVYYSILFLLQKFQGHFQFQYPNTWKTFNG